MSCDQRTQSTAATLRAKSTWSPFRNQWAHTQSGEVDKCIASHPSSKSVEEKHPVDMRSYVSEYDKESEHWSLRKVWAYRTSSSPAKKEDDNLVQAKVVQEENTRRLSEKPVLAPRCLSITVRQPSNTSDRFYWKLDLHQDEETREIIVREILEKSSLRHDDFSSSSFSIPLLQTGDILLSINGYSCNDLDITEVQNLLDGHSGGLVTVLVRRPEGNPALIQASAIIRQGQIEGDEDMTSGFMFGESVSSSSMNKASPRCVQICEKTIYGYLSHSALEPGDVILSINNNKCDACSPSDVDMLLHSHLQYSRTTTILAQRPDTSKKWTVRKVAVAAAGGSMVSVGAVIMVTPLHPVGHALAIGGVGVLSTEFEGPRRVIESTRQRLNDRFRKSPAATPTSIENTNAPAA